MKARQKARKVEESRGKTAVETTTETTGIIGETIGGTDKRPVESPVESPCGHRRRIAMHGPAGLTMRCECCGAVLSTRSMLTNANTAKAARG